MHQKRVKGLLIIFSTILAMGLSFLDTVFIPMGCAFSQEAVTLLEPESGATVIAKKPDIRCSFAVPVLKETLYIAIDQTDMTALADITESGFSLTPFHVLAAGDHTLEVTFLDPANVVHTKTYGFSTRHSAAFETLTSTNNLSVIYSQVVQKLDAAKSRAVSDWEVEGNLSSQSMIAQGPWELSFKTNARYTDQQLAVSEPVEKGLTLVDYTLIGKFQADKTAFTAGLGDVSVEGTKNIISSLSRRGGTLGVESEHFFVNGFSLRSQQIYGLDDGQDAEPDTDDHLVGIAGGIHVFEKKINLKMIYVNGGDQASESSHGIWPDSAGTSGDACGVELKTDFFDQRLVTLLEYDISDFDENTADAAASDSDKAYHAGMNGVIGFFNYDLAYEYTGPDYQVVTSSLAQDRKGGSARIGFSSSAQSLMLNASRYTSNLDNRITDPRLETIEYGAACNLTAAPSLPVSAGWQRSLQNSSSEPSGTSEIKNTTDRIFGSLSYLSGSWVMGLQPEYSRLDDETSVNNDTRSKNLTLFAGYNSEKFSLSPSVSFSRFKDCATDIETETINYNLTFMLNMYNGLIFEGAGSYGGLDTSDSTVDQENFNGDLQLSYQLQEPIGGIFSPKILLRASHDNTSDNAAGTSSKETIVYLLISGSLDLSF